MKFFKKNFVSVSVISLPIYFFLLVIIVGAIILHMPISGGHLTWIDAFFISTSATCVTGLSVVNLNESFSIFGQYIILILIQIGGLGVMTYGTLIFYLWRKRISLTDRIAVGQNLLHDPTFNLGKFIKQIVLSVFLIELIGALLLYLYSPKYFSPFSAIFHSISAFCNAGFSLFSDSLVYWQNDCWVNVIFIVLIFFGGIGFSVLMELFVAIKNVILNKEAFELSWYSRMILKTTFFLIIFGWIGLYSTEFFGTYYSHHEQGLIPSLFQSVTARTAGFNSIQIGHMTNVSLLLIIMLMFIGGGSGSCAGGVKISTFRVFMSYIYSQIRGRRQVVINHFAVDYSTLNRSLILIIFSLFIIITATVALNFTEAGHLSHLETRGLGLEILFEVVSAFATVGLTTGLTTKLSIAGKIIIMFLMFIGRLGPILFIAVIQNKQKKELFKWPEKHLLIG